MLTKSIICPVCKIPLPKGISVCPDCKQDLSALIYLEHQSEILYNQGLSLAQSGDDKQAAVILRKSLDLDKSNLAAALVLGKIYARRKEYLEARTIWNQAQQAHPESTELQEQLAALDAEIEADQGMKAQTKLELALQERDSKRRKMLYRLGQIGLAFIFGCVALAAYQLIFRSNKPVQPNGPVVQVDISTLQAFQTAAAVIQPSPTVNPTATPTVNPTAIPTMQDLLPLIKQAIRRDPSLSGLGLEFVQSGNIIYVTGEAPDIRTRYLIEVTVRSVAGVEVVDMIGLKVANGDIISPPSRCLVDLGIQGGQLNLREGPGTQYNVIGLVPEGDVLAIMQLGNWYQVITSDGITGWVYSYYCRTE